LILCSYSVFEYHSKQTPDDLRTLLAVLPQSFVNLGNVSQIRSRGLPSRAAVARLREKLRKRATNRPKKRCPSCPPFGRERSDGISDIGATASEQVDRFGASEARKGFARGLLSHLAQVGCTTRYAGRYVRRPHIAQRRFAEISEDGVEFWIKDLRN
jgi:hypothetical protein